MSTTNVRLCRARRDAGCCFAPGHSRLACLTLASGAAIAGGSTTGACLTNQTTTTQRFTTTKDQWLRKSVYDGKSGSQGAYCVSGDTSKPWACVDYQGKAAQGSVWIKRDGSRITAGPANNVSNVETTPYYGLVYVDKNGQMTLDPNGSTTMYATTYGCAVSAGLIANSQLLG